MTLPGFTAGASLAPSGPRFGRSPAGMTPEDGEGVHPAFPWIMGDINLCWYYWYIDPSGYLRVERYCL